MKKNIFNLLGIAGLLLASSCSMDNEPVGSLVEDEALISANDCFRFRNGFYNNLRSVSTGAYIAYTELQMDLFIGTKINGNQQGPINNGDINSADGDIESIWGGLFGVIGDANYFLGKIDEVIANTTRESDLAELKRYRAEAHFIRGYFYYWLLDHYCPANTPGNEAYGLPLVTVYAPTHIKDDYPSRSSQADTYAFIENDLKVALQGLEEYEQINSSIVASNAPYISSFAVRCLQARLALLKGDYDTAKNISEAIIASGKFPLTTYDAYATLWTQDTGTEVVFRPISTSEELGIASTGGYWNSTSDISSNYVPVPYACQVGTEFLYDNRRDARYRAFFFNKERELVMEGRKIKTPIFAKYMGNSALQTVAGTPNMMNMPKPFRMSEQYLIAAEANCELGNDGPANTYLNELRRNRLPNYTDATYSGDQLRTQVRLERSRELIGEGFRMSDLRRWHQGFVREASHYTSYPDAAEIVTVAGNGVTYQVNDYRFTWPIPATELQVNPHMAGQQNPGY